MFSVNPYIASIMLVCIFALEGVFPHYGGRAARFRHALPHLAAALLNGLIKWFFLIGPAMAAILWASSRSVGLMRLLPLPYAARTAVIFILFDLWLYFWHLANHRIAFLQRFHRAHHSDTEMDVTTALRFHPGELILSAFIRLPVVVLLGMSFMQLALFELLLNISVLFHHSNLAVPENWDRALRAAITTPDMHRVHHSADPAGTNSNFTSILSVWDRLLGTFKVPGDTRSLTLGLPSFRGEKWQRLWGFLITPLQ